MARKVEVTDIWRQRIKEQFSGLVFGTVQIVVHDGRIVQIEQTERIRFQDEAQSPATGRKSNIR